MLRASITFFVLGLISMFLGINSIAGLSIDIGKVLLTVFMILSILSFFMGRSRGKGTSLVGILLLAFMSSPTWPSEKSHDVKRAAKDSVRYIQDRTCELVNGKIECAFQKAKHFIQKGSDKV